MRWKTIGKSKFVSYEISDTGLIRALRKGVYRLVKPTLHSKGYLKISTKAIGGKYIHRYVAEAFLPIIDGKPHVNHKDGVKTNNHYTNLEWCTIEENNLHSQVTGLSDAKIPCSAYGRNCEVLARFEGTKASYKATEFLGRGNYVIIKDHLATPEYIKSMVNKRFFTKRTYKRVKPVKKKLSEQEISEIRQKYKFHKVTAPQLGKEYCVSKTTILCIVKYLKSYSKTT